MTRLSVALDGRALGDASAYRGLGTYLRLLLEGLGAAAGAGGLGVSVLVRRGVTVPPGVRSVEVRRRAPDRWATAEHHLLLPGELARLRADVVHSPALDPPRRVSGPWVQTVPDVLPLVDPDPAFSVERHRWRRWSERVRRADAVITFSCHSAAQITEHLGLEAGRVRVVPLAPDPRYRPGAPPGDAGAPYFLYVGEYGPHKGFREAARVMAELAERGLPHRLLVAGRVAPSRRAAVESELSAGGAKGRRRIEVLGWVPELLPLYRGATALVVTSRHEGFGLPAVEAMATGTPVVAFANSALPEVVGGGGWLVADGDTAAMAEALADLAGHPALRARAARAALDRSAAFDRDEMTRRHLEIYRSVGSP